MVKRYLWMVLIEYLNKKDMGEVYDGYESFKRIKRKSTKT